MYLHCDGISQLINMHLSVQPQFWVGLAGHIQNVSIMSSIKLKEKQTIC